VSEGEREAVNDATGAGALLLNVLGDLVQGALKRREGGREGGRGGGREGGEERESKTF